MIADRRLIPSSPGHGFNLVLGRERVGNEATGFHRDTFRMNLVSGRERAGNEAMGFRRDTSEMNLVSGRERVGNEAVVSTWFPAGAGLVTNQLVFGVTRLECGGIADGVMKPYDRTPKIASRLTCHSIGRALDEARPNKSLLPTGLGPSTSTPDLLNRPAAE